MAETQTFALKHPGTCTGMFWRPNPSGTKEIQIGNHDWPKNGALLTGVVHERPDMKWLHITKWRQAGGTDWTENCQGLWMPFEQGGLLLHLQENM